MTVRDLLAWNVRKLRVLRELSQERLAFEAGLERVSISQIERKRINLGIDSAERIALALDVPVHALFISPSEGEEPPATLKRGRRPLS
ncbi:helix-turn-helix transcriptional regulator [Neorhizobium petrolearium]|uniref:Helix-turn-helix transcriptional regulator n=1 Tax=Neorhizobium petrolearium TaxID=515361 RepID=A0ABY8MCP3_9HYPH|nr:helix-turn-helix transcriptional regulator [Neorhizobium petrolearium]MCC2614456.1 helix-turn-helix domain-containing protein [Neorhizobium petrolearium]WGI72222.1 helix-turn-helix transcriptional regulator [Neorhizobium petrolearium]